MSEQKIRRSIFKNDAAFTREKDKYPDTGFYYSGEDPALKNWFYSPHTLSVLILSGFILFFTALDEKNELNSQSVNVWRGVTAACFVFLDQLQSDLSLHVPDCGNAIGHRTSGIASCINPVFARQQPAFTAHKFEGAFTDAELLYSVGLLHPFGRWFHRRGFR